MTLKDNTAELADIAKVTTEAARLAGDFLATGYRTHVAFEHKSSRSDLVTRFDRESEELLRKALAPTGIAFVGEETGGATADRMFYVDPLDGTTNYAHGHPMFCVSIGLVENGEPIFGAVCAPALGVLWTGGAGIPAMRNDVAARVSQVAAIEDALLATGFPSDRRVNPLNNFDAFLHMKMRCQAIRRCGAAALDLCFVADGTYEGYWERVQPWDIAGGAAILHAAGGKTSSMDGTPVSFGRRHVVASNGAIHAALLAELANVESTKRW
jgi:myo-inositol-1(or 4)-monophosphatase